jgi:TatD DNase family protein
MPRPPPSSVRSVSIVGFSIVPGPTIHCLDAWSPLGELLRSAPALPARGFLLHAYGGPAEMIKTFAGLGAYFSFNGSFLDERRARQLDTFRHVPPDRLLIETDAPAMPFPSAWRTHKLPLSSDGQVVNHPGNLEAAYTGLAAFLGETLPALAARVEKNFQRLFGL